MSSEFKIEKLYAHLNRTYKMIGLILIIVGIAGVTYPFWGISTSPRPNPLEELGRSEVAAQILTASSSNDSPAAPDNATKTAPATQNRLIIESAGVDMPLFSSANDKVLLKGGWMYSGNSTPDKGGNTVVFGHRWLYKPPIKNTFFNLDKVTVGDRFTIIWSGKTYNYEVSRAKIVAPTEVSVLNPTKSPQVTLITCTPLFSTKQRLVIVGQLIQ